MSETKDRENQAKGDAADHMATGGEIGKGYLTGPGLHEHPVDFHMVDGRCLHEGCIDMGSVEEVEAETRRVEQATDTLRSATPVSADGEAEGPDIQMGVGLPTGSSYLWTNGVVPYTVAADVPSQGRVSDAIQHIEDNTAIRFVERTSGNKHKYPNYIRIISNGEKGWSSSAIGMRGGRQDVRLSDKHSWPILVHELLHALGVYHEQSRSDRDQYVKIRWSNIPDGPPPEGEKDWTGNFQKKPGSVDYLDYDYGSIMHYGPKSAARDPSKPTIVPLKDGVTIGQRKGMSFGDRQTIALMYQRFFEGGYAGVWRAGSGPYALWVNASWSSFRSKWQQWSARGLRLHDIHVRRVGGKTRYSGVFRPGSGRHALWANVTWSSFRAKWKELSQQGLRLVDLHVHRAGGQNRYSGVFLAGSGGYGLWVDGSWNAFRNKWQEWTAQNLRLVDLHVHRVGGKNRYSGVFRGGSGGHGLWVNANWSSFLGKWKESSAQGLRLADLNLHRSGSSIRYSGAFLPGNDKHALWANVTYESLRAKWEELGQKGLRLVDFEIVNPESTSSAGADLADGFDAFENTASEAFGGLFGLPEAADESALPEVEELEGNDFEDGGGLMGLESKGGDTDGPSPSGAGDAVFQSAPEGEDAADGEGFGEIALGNSDSEATTEDALDHGGMVGVE